MVRASVLASSVSWVRIPPEQLFFIFGEKRVVWVSCLSLFSIYRKEFSWKIYSLVPGTAKILHSTNDCEFANNIVCNLILDWSREVRSLTRRRGNHNTSCDVNISS